jgi:hypothetical protein
VCASGGPMQGLMGGGLSRSASGIKDFLLQWCQSRTRGYKVRISSFFLSLFYDYLFIYFLLFIKLKTLKTPKIIRSLHLSIWGLYTKSWIPFDSLPIPFDYSH